VEAIRDPGGVSPFSNASELDALGVSRPRSGPPRGKVNDAVSFLWRWELAGHPRDADSWRMLPTADPWGGRQLYRSRRQEAGRFPLRRPSRSGPTY